MVAMKVNRINLLEVNQISIRSRKCGSGPILDMEQAGSVARRCPSCGFDFGSNVEECFRRLHDAHFEAKTISDRFKVGSTLPEWVKKYEDFILGAVVDVVVEILNRLGFFEHIEAAEPASKPA